LENPYRGGPIPSGVEERDGKLGRKTLPEIKRLHEVEVTPAKGKGKRGPPRGARGRLTGGKKRIRDPKMWGA